MSSPTDTTPLPLADTKPPSSPTTTNGGIPWQDRRGMFQRGKEVHEPARRPSQSYGGAGGTAVLDAVRRGSTASSNAGSLVDKPLTNDPGSSPSSPIGGGRRRSSAASNGGKFSNLTHHKRGSEDYAARRASQTEQNQAGGGVMAGWFNSTFRGVQKPSEQKPEKRGVME
ncbi:hypothetical protein TI39_contig468g00023 [Zymoseptoria brevis]|uniref:Uncharacterized protein n=1 Tax=Zymoseptoria brevis TaxID=1047168 RepID=A0A0F4GND5_9PEZI|nr:hypothetical protein TI39_contig468g00023 [Zymoseptoria brevis]